MFFKIQNKHYKNEILLNSIQFVNKSLIYCFYGQLYFVAKARRVASTSVTERTMSQAVRNQELPMREACVILPLFSSEIAIFSCRTSVFIKTYPFR